MPQPQKMMKERRRPVCGIGEPEMVPARVEKPFEQLWTLERLRLRLGRPVPIVCRRTARRLVSGFDEIRDQQRASLGQTVGDSLVQVLLLGIVQLLLSGDN